MTPFEQAVRTVRFLSVDAVEKAGSGHPGTPMALAGITVDLFTRYLRYNPEDPAWPNRDRFVLSCGHASMLLYSVLHLAGYDVSVDDLKAFRQYESKTPGHPEYSHTPGVETTTGPLGQGLGNAVGMALAAKLAGERVNHADASLIDYRVFVLASDGDIMEGVAGEAASLAGHLKLDNLVVVYDANQITIDGATDLSFSEDVAGRFESLGWQVWHVDGHAPEEVRRALDAAVAAERPALIVARTHIGYGSPNKQDSAAAHGAALGADEVRATKEAAGWPLEPTFHVPAEAYEPFRAWRAENQRAYDAWQKKVQGLQGDTLQSFKALLNREVPADLLEQLIAARSTKADATRGHAGHIQQKVAELVPGLVGGSADLAGSVKTTIKGGGDIGPGAFGGRNFHFGVREHGMGAILNGLALSGLFVPYGSTFLIFSDYMRPPMRLAALMRQQVVYVFSHDSIYLGEDGPTHQPVEQLWSLRLVPNLDVVRPADSLECAAAWTHALSRRDGPTVLSLTRHTVPELPRPADFDPRQMLDGAYVLAEAADPTLVLIATGSEVSVALEAKALLERAELGARAQRVRVVSMPCVEAFLRLPPEKKNAVLPPGVRRATFEIGVTTPWRAIAGLDGICIGLDRFGASAPWKEIATRFGFTAAQVADRILEELSPAS
ncbi:MAG: transketolase [Myxococcales bacterium]|jgi:transketolase|nr:transketolase [Myxococcales bacterium]